jgi:molybdate/tungstate transport system permease protein
VSLGGDDYNKARMRRLLIVVLCTLAACERRTRAAPITVYAAASLARSLRTLSDSFTARTGVPVRSTLGGSMELIRRITDLGQTPDVLILVDDQLMAELVPSYVSWYARFGTNHIVIAFSPTSRHADSITNDNWWRVLSRSDVSVGRADAAIAPAGRHALAILRGAETYYHRPGLTKSLMARATDAFVRPDAAQLAALLEAGEVDYILDYESVAQQYGFRYVTVPNDLAVAVVYAVSVPTRAPHPSSADDFAAYMLSDDGKRILRSAHVNVLDVPVVVGSKLPKQIDTRVRTVPAAERTLSLVAALVASAFLLFVAGPLLGLLATGGASGVAALATDAELRSSLLLTISAATLATLAGIIGATPVAYALARGRFRGRSLLAAVIDLPLLIPHPVAGIALLLVLGRQTPIGRALWAAGVQLTGSLLGIVCAMLFVSAPLYVSAAREAFDRVDPRFEGVARTLGDGPWRALRRVTLPLAWRGLLAAGIVMWARAVSEFGAIVILVYHPRVASVLSYERFTTYGLRGALPVAAILVLVALIPLALLRALRGDERLPVRRR